MTSPIPLTGGEAFYAPAFEVRRVEEGGTALVVHEERNIRRDALYDIQAVTYTDNLEEIDSFTLRVANWDALRRRPKYFGYAAPPSGSETEWATMFDLGRRFDIRLGYRGNLRTVISGYVTGVTAAFPQTGTPTLSVDGLDAFLKKARGEQYSDRWLNKTDSQIAKELSGPRPDRRRPGFECPVRVSDQAADKEATNTRVVMHNQSVISFLIERARLHCYSVFVGYDNNRPYIYFGPSEQLPDVTYSFQWGRTLLEFRPVLRVAGAVHKATVRWWDRQRGRKVETTAAAGDPGLTMNSDHFGSLRQVGEERTIIDRVVRTEKEAQQIARCTVLRSLKRLAEATGTTIGLPDLRAGSVIKVTGLDNRLDGRWFVTQTVHTIDENGYRTTFQARREREEPGSGSP
jgi:phage protein D